MTTRTRQSGLCAALAAGMTLLAGCCCFQKKGGCSDNDEFGYDGGKCDPQVRITIDRNDGGPTGNSGTLTIPVNSFSSGNNGQACFPSGANWDRYYVTFYLLGPNVNPPPNPNNYPNSGNLSNVTISTIDPANGTMLDTGIVIMENTNPNNKVCNDDAIPPDALNPKLSKAKFSPTVSGKKYRVTVFYKSATLGNLTSVKVNWSYP